MPTTTHSPIYFCACGARADTPKECCGKIMGESPNEFTTITSLSKEEKIEQDKITAQNKIAAESNEEERLKEAILKQIGELVILKNGKLEVGLDTTEEDSKIEELKLKLV